MYDFTTRQAQTGYRVQYRAGESNRCPGCDRTSWIVGRFSAECAHCGTAIEMQGAARQCLSGLVRAA